MAHHATWRINNDGLGYPWTLIAVVNGQQSRQVWWTHAAWPSRAMKVSDGVAYPQ